MTDIEIAKKFKPKNIVKIAKKLGLGKKDLILFGNYKAKINIKNNKKLKDLFEENQKEAKSKKSFKKAKLILVTAISPTKSGNGKTTVSIGLADAFKLKHKKVCLALREPSLGPVFGMKGGATGGGYSQVLPMEDINLHFNGDFHAITSANNLLASYIDNHIFQGNKLEIDENKIFFNRCFDCNDRALRDCTVSESKNCTPHKEKFVITSASEIMAIMCLSKNIEDLKEKLGNIMIALSKNGKPIFAKDLHAEESMTILLKDALKPNLVQTLAGTPAIVHLGPFANIAHGCNSIIATKTAMALSDYCVTEAGFGSDLGAEKFIDIKCRQNNIFPDAVVLVATIKSLKLNGGQSENELEKENLVTLKQGISNLKRHLYAFTNVYKIPVVVTLNMFSSDTKQEIDFVSNEIEKLGVRVIVNTVWENGGKGALELCDEIIRLTNLKSQKNQTEKNFVYDLTDKIETKILKIAKKIYGAKKVEYSDEAKKQIKILKKLNYSNLPICVAKTQYSFSDNAKLLGAPTNFSITVRSVEVKSGAGFIVAILGNMLLMPALGKNPAGLNMQIDSNENIKGLF